MAYRHNQSVEVRGKQEGFSGFYYPATLLAAVETNRYLVRYKTRFTEDKSRLLTEALDAADIWTVPLEIQSTSFVVGERTKACLNGGWWPGKTEQMVDPYYYVRLDGTENEIHFPFYRVRTHLVGYRFYGFCGTPFNMPLVLYWVARNLLDPSPEPLSPALRYRAPPLTENHRKTPTDYRILLPPAIAGAM
ncbi:hypothetical protein U1Q18_023552 [Sarracenia purpurea var. burkii]